MSKKPRVLCIDDQPLNLKVRAMLLEQFGCDVLTAEDQHTALKIVTEDQVDILFIDYHLANGATREELPVLHLGRPASHTNQLSSGRNCIKRCKAALSNSA